jgi:hypothetical protein
MPGKLPGKTPHVNEICDYAGPTPLRYISRDGLAPQSRVCWFLMRKKIAIGDVIEIETKHGMAYAQFYQNHVTPPGMGTLLRILPGFFSERPKDLAALATVKEVFSTFFCVQAAVNRKIVQVAGHAEVPPHARPFPIFRFGFPNQETGKVEQWNLWDGVKQWRIGKLTDEQLDFPIRGIPSFPLLVDWLETGWTPRRDEEFIDRARAELKQAGAAAGGPMEVEEMHHFLVVNDEESGERALKMIRDMGLVGSLTDLGESWGVSVLQTDLAADKIERLTEQLEKIASAVGGVYDGNQVKLGGD